MLATIVEFSLRARLLVGVLALALAGSGLLALRSLPIDAFPDVSPAQVKIIMKAPGMTPEEVESRIVAPIELAMLGIPNQKMLRSVSKYAIADLTIDFDDAIDIYWARQQVTERLNGVLPEMPAGVTGGLAPITTPLGEMFMFTIEGGELSLTERRSLLDWVIRPALRTIPGVADVNSLGGHARAFEVVPNEAALQARGLGIDVLRDALAHNNRNDGAGRIAEGEEALLVRTEGSVHTLRDVREIVVAMRAGVPVRVGDVAQVRIGSLTRYGAVTRDGQAEAVQGLVLGLRGTNARQLVESVRERLAQLQPSLPAGVRTEVFYDRGALVDRAVGTVGKALFEAIALVLVLLLAFLGSLRAAIVVAATLPMAVLGAFLLMRYSGMSANLMSLGGLAVAIGMLVDSAVVVVENVTSRLAAQKAQDRHARIATVYRAVVEVAAPVTSGISIIIIVFLPLLTLQGLEGKLFSPVALAIVFALSASLLLSLTLVPVLSSLLLRPGAHAEPWLVRMLDRLYAPLLARALACPRTVLALAIAALALAGLAYSAVGKTFMPTLDEGDVIMQLEKLPSIGLDESVRSNLQVQKAILTAVPEVRSIVARSGSDELGLDPMGLNQTDLFMVLAPLAQWRNPDKSWLLEQLRGVMENFPGIGFSFTQPIEMRVSEMLTGVRGDLAVKIFGPDLATLNALARKIEMVLRAVPGNQDVFTLTNEGVQYLRIAIDRMAAGRYGLGVDQIAELLKGRLEGVVTGIVPEPGMRTPLLLRGEQSLRESPQRFEQLMLALPDGRAVALRELARIERVDGPVKIDRENASRYSVVQSNVSGRDLVGFVDDARAQVERKVQLPPGYRLVWGGQFENQQRAAARLMLVVPTALALIFVLLFATFGSLRQSALVFANIPFAMVGGAIALWASGQYMSVPASVGFIALLGIAVLNGVVLVSHYNTLLEQGMDVAQVVVEGSRRRLRPVLMTATIAAFGLLPLLFATGPGSEIQRPLAIVVIGGLASSTALTLFLLPILYRRFCPAVSRTQAWRPDSRAEPR
jgi:cobalt-zinc-cadmium resistance protein CzcA